MHTIVLTHTLNLIRKVIQINEKQTNALFQFYMLISIYFSKQLLVSIREFANLEIEISIHKTP